MAHKRTKPRQNDKFTCLRTFKFHGKQYKRGEPFDAEVELHILERLCGSHHIGFEETVNKAKKKAAAKRTTAKKTAAKKPAAAPVSVRTAPVIDTPHPAPPQTQ